MLGVHRIGTRGQRRLRSGTRAVSCGHVGMESTGDRRRGGERGSSRTRRAVRGALRSLTLTDAVVSDGQKDSQVVVDVSQTKPQSLSASLPSDAGRSPSKKQGCSASVASAQVSVSTQVFPDLCATGGPPGSGRGEQVRLQSRLEPSRWLSSPVGPVTGGVLARAHRPEIGTVSGPPCRGTSETEVSKETLHGAGRDSLVMPPWATMQGAREVPSGRLAARRPASAPVAARKVSLREQNTQSDLLKMLLAPLAPCVDEHARSGESQRRSQPSKKQRPSTVPARGRRATVRTDLDGPFATVPDTSVGDFYETSYGRACGKDLRRQPC